MVTFNEQRLAQLCRQYDVAVLKIFGSAARGEDTDESDVDLLVEFRGRKGLLDLVALENALSQELGRKVDLVTEASLSPYIRDGALESARVIYAGEE